MVDASSRQVPALRQLYVYVTDRCNCACKHCWIVPDPHGAHDGPKHYLAPEVFDAAVVEAKPLGLRWVKWTGGEPTIHPRLAHLLELQRKHELWGRMETNGMEVTPETARLLKRTNVRHVSVSLDGCEPETHDAIRGVPGAHRRALEGVRNLVEAGFKPQLIMTLMTDNADQVEGLLELAQTVGAGSVKLNIVQPTLRGEDLHASGATLSVDQLIDLQSRVESDWRPKSRLPIFFDLPMAFRSLRRILDGDGCSVCGIMSILGLLADGNYALCGIGESVQEMVFGRAGSGLLGTIWAQHPVLLKIRDGLPGELKGVCARCLMKEACLGCCVAQNYYRTSDLLEAFWFCELAEEAGLFPVTRLRG